MGALAAVAVLCSAAGVAAARSRAPVTLPRPVPCSGGPCYIPRQGSLWQWQICCSTERRASNYAGIRVHVSFYDVDGFENDGSASGTVAGVHRQGRRVICYLDAGSYEDWRPDAPKFRGHPGLIGAPLVDWPHQWWVDIRKKAILYPIIQARLDMCGSRGYDGVQFDDIVVWQEANQGFGSRVSARDELLYAIWLANEAHKRGLSAAFENDIEQAGILVRYYDWAIFEDCTRYAECHAPGLTAFLHAGKFVGDVEYTDWRRLPPLQTWCAALERGTSGMLKHRPLDFFRKACA
jgi:hypothetical protein